MKAGKQQLLRRHKRHKRIGLGLALLALLIAGVLVAWWLVPLLALLLWLAHEAWLSDHRFYNPRQDDSYNLTADWHQRLRIDKGCLNVPAELPDADTLVLALEVKASLSGHFIDPWLELGGQKFSFERGCRGRRYLVLAREQFGQEDAALILRTGHCQLGETLDIHGFGHPDYGSKRLLILAPHADDAELAAFGLYQRATEVMILTLTQGETKADDYQRLGLGLGLGLEAAARLKGRLRTWDSLAIPLWGGVPQEQCLQLGYYCLQLAAMRAAPDEPQGSLESGETDIRSARAMNSSTLPADGDGLPTWRNLVADLAAVLEQYRPEVILLPHPRLDPHPDHIATGQALAEALSRTNVPIDHFLLYANHLHDTDLWPFGPVGTGIGLPPWHGQGLEASIWINPLSSAQQLDKIMALRMQHDLQRPLRLKLRLRRLIQWALARRRWPATGLAGAEDDFFRKAVRSGEVFFVCTTVDPFITQGQVKHE